MQTAGAFVGKKKLNNKVAQDNVANFLLYEMKKQRKKSNLRNLKTCLLIQFCIDKADAGPSLCSAGEFYKQ